MHTVLDSGARSANAIEANYVEGPITARCLTFNNLLKKLKLERYLFVMTK